jgi:two-component system, NtrC family, response regulator AtoC
MKPKILVIDDEKIVRETLQEAFVEQGYNVKVASSGLEGLKEFSRFEPDLVILDLVLGDFNGMDILKKIRKENQETQIIIITAHGDVGEAIEAGKIGALDFIKKPYELDEILNHSMNALNTHSLKQRLNYLEVKEKERFRDGKIIGESQKINQVMETLNKISESDLPTTILITGESGTGKEMLARALHYGSSRQTQPFIEFNCSAIPENLIESELFGYEKGAFTDARKKRIGLVELADSGTLFLDEIADMSLSLQAKMLKFIEEKKFRRLGGSDLIDVDIRIITATNKDLKQLIDEEKFRPDLYYRLNVVSIELPSLRERGDDVFLLADYFLDKYNKIFSKRFKNISEPVKKVFRKYNWPGNIRELKNLMERIILLEKGQEITINHLPQDMLSAVLTENLIPEKEKKGEIYSFEELESVYAHRVFQFCNENKTKAAKLLGIDRHTLDKKLKSQDDK